ncbi:MAG: hypothetical protein N2315_02180 [Thermanaerothrix sp.]|nr:hypothetical protein [Thermanaerothrix sp.]
MKSFRLESGNPVEFMGYTVRLEQGIYPLNPAGEYVLSVRWGRNPSG